ncbi:uncharacterized protein LOC128033895 [Gossypium raimondii]|uniref:uncharacterized protein LOC128033895 n=1 Tax=Gossypium raimondii TaxID=29730 RepID=UPI00227AB76F|nr:uncharacterized protein LOC128033895 [Gossypium raimondii]
MARWQNLLSEFDIVYASQKTVKGSAIADFLASRALEDYEPLNFDFPSKDLIIEEEEKDDHPWYLNILQYVKNREHPDQATGNEKRALRRIAIDYVLDEEILYKKGMD